MPTIITYTFYNQGLWNDKVQMLRCCWAALCFIRLLKKQKKKIAFYKEVPIAGDGIAPCTHIRRKKKWPTPRTKTKLFPVYAEPIDHVEVGFYK